MSSSGVETVEMAGKHMHPEKIVIKKYGNRRLYDTTNSQYVNLDEVARMVRDGRDIQVVDAVTGEDLTRTVLTQIVVEQSKGEDSAFPLDVLRQMIAASGKATRDAALTYVKAVSEMYQNAYRTVAPIVPKPGAAAPDVDALLKRLEELESTVSTLRSKRVAPRATAKKKRR